MAVPRNLLRILQKSALNSASPLNASHPRSFPVIDTCPSPSCACAPTPTGLDINHTIPLPGTMAPHSKHLVISTSKEDWPARIEDMESPNLAQSLKSMLKTEEHHDGHHSVMISNSSFNRIVDLRTKYGLEHEGGFTSAYLFPDFKFIPIIGNDSDTQNRLVRAFLTRDKYPAPVVEGRRRSSPGLESIFPRTADVTNVIILICGHASRDKRCGIMGPLLKSEFHRLLNERTGGAGPRITGLWHPSRTSIALCSHIGGHQFAGNMIIYVPPRLRLGGGLRLFSKAHPLAGKGIWYGRVEPRHVEGIIEETIVKGNVIAELFRGGIGRNGDTLAL